MTKKELEQQNKIMRRALKQLADVGIDIAKRALYRCPPSGTDGK